jgi:hypothetical protein
MSRVIDHLLLQREAGYLNLAMPREELHNISLQESRELTQLSAVQFMGVWEHYDTDGNGFIEGEELDSFLQEFVSSVHPEQEEVIMGAGGSDPI